MQFEFLFIFYMFLDLPLTNNLTMSLNNIKLWMIQPKINNRFSKNLQPDSTTIYLFRLGQQVVEQTWRECPSGWRFCRWWLRPSCCCCCLVGWGREGSCRRREGLCRRWCGRCWGRATRGCIASSWRRRRRRWAGSALGVALLVWALEWLLQKVPFGVNLPLLVYLLPVDDLLYNWLVRDFLWRMVSSFRDR